MEFDKKSLLKLGKLARISISDDKLNNLSKDLNSILEFVDQLKEIKTDQVDPTSNSLNQKLEVRDWSHTKLRYVQSADPDKSLWLDCEQFDPNV